MCARYDKEWIASLLDVEDRLGDTTPERCLRDAGVTAGQTVVDYGCGPGLFTFPAAEIVGAEGKVYAVDIEPRMTALIASRAAELGSQNVTALLNEGVAPLPSGTADFLILAQVLHYPDETDERVAMARDVARLLRTGGRALVIEWTPMRRTIASPRRRSRAFSGRRASRRESRAHWGQDSTRSSPPTGSRRAL